MCPGPLGGSSRLRRHPSDPVSVRPPPWVVALVCLLGIIGALEFTSFDTGVAACSAQDQVRKGGVASLKQEHAAAGPRRHLSRALHGGTCRRYRAHAPPYPDPSPNTSPAELPTLLPCFHSSTFAMMAAPMGGWRSGWPQARQRWQADDAARWRAGAPGLTLQLLKLHSS